jgi:hypothetical protein
MTAISTILSPNVERWLHQYHGIDTIEEAQKLTDEQLLGVPNIGKMKVQKIRNYKPKSPLCSDTPAPAVSECRDTPGLARSFKEAVRPLMKDAFRAGVNPEYGFLSIADEMRFEEWFALL